MPPPMPPPPCQAPTRCRTRTLYIVCIALYILWVLPFSRDHRCRRPRHPRPDPRRDEPAVASSGLYGDRHQTDCGGGRCAPRFRVPLLPGRQGADRGRGPGPGGGADPDGDRVAGERGRRPCDRQRLLRVQRRAAAATPTTSAAARSRPWRSRRRTTSSASARCARTCSTVGRPRWPTSSPKPASPRPTPSALATFVLSSYEGALTMSRALRDIQPMLTSGAAVASVLHAHLGDAPRAG